MNHALEISIPKSCHEDWRKFTPTATGGFCKSCQKEVIDFTRWTDVAIVQHFAKAPTNTCGRFREGQLQKFQTPPRRKLPLPIAALLALTVFGINKQAEAKVPKLKAAVEQFDAVSTCQNKADTWVEKIIITGTVRDEEGIVLPGVNIVRKGFADGVVSDALGKFMLVIYKPAYMERLQFSFIGMISQEWEIVATQSSKSLDAFLKPDFQTLGEVIVYGWHYQCQALHTPRAMVAGERFFYQKIVGTNLWLGKINSFASTW